jgi:biopolymer transport protein ExbD
MQFPDPPRRRAQESIVPMINVVFLLLIFFLMTAQIAPPEPFAVTPPEVAADGPPADAQFVLYLGPEGELAFRDSRGEEAALAALSAARAAACPAQGCADTAASRSLVLRADAGVPGTRLAALMPRIAAAGFAEVQLITVAE